MISFRSHLTSPKIVMWHADAASQRTWRAWCEIHGFDVAHKWSGQRISPAEFDFHLTLFASRNPILRPVGERALSPVTLSPAGFAVLGEDTPVATFAPCPALTDERDRMITQHAVEPTFPSFRPHVSLSYNWSGTPALNLLPLPPPITFDRESTKVFDTLKEAVIELPSMFSSITETIDSDRIVYKDISFRDMMGFMREIARSGVDPKLRVVMTKDRRHWWVADARFFLHVGLRISLAKETGLLFDRHGDLWIARNQGRYVVNVLRASEQEFRTWPIAREIPPGVSVVAYS